MEVSSILSSAGSGCVEKLVKELNAEEVRGKTGEYWKRKRLLGFPVGCGDEGVPG